MGLGDGSGHSDERASAAEARIARARAGDRRGRAHERPHRPVPGRRQARDPAPGRLPRPRRAGRRAGTRVERDGRRRDDDGRRPDRVRRARRRRRREGLLRAQGGQATRPRAPDRRAAARRTRPLHAGRGRRHHRRLDDRGPGGAARRGPPGVRRARDLRPSRGRRGGDQGGRAGALREPRNDRRRLPRPPRTAPTASRWSRHASGGCVSRRPTGVGGCGRPGRPGGWPARSSGRSSAA